MPISVSEAIVKALADKGIEDCFCVVGGGALHLDRALSQSDRIKTHFCHHEQACAMAAEAYARIKGKPALVCVTSGPGATNAITGVTGAYQDGIPMVILSGNVRNAVSVRSTGLSLRYRGIQEFDIVSAITGTTKRAIYLDNPCDAVYEAQAAYEESIRGRQGPCWIDVPLDVQASRVTYTKLKKYRKPVKTKITLKTVKTILAALKEAQRPMVLLGSSVGTCMLHNEMEQFIGKFGIPTVGGAWFGDSLSREVPYYYGGSGNVGPRAGNYIIDSADCILVLGNSLSFRQTGYDINRFADGARIIMVDIDVNEYLKISDRVDIFAEGNIADFISHAMKTDMNLDVDNDWIEYCESVKAAFPPFEQIEKTKKKGRVNKYRFWKKAYDILPDDAILSFGNSQVCLAGNQIGKAHREQRIVENSNCGAMGSDLPFAIGAAIAGERDVYCITGDGCFMMNLQELETIAYMELPVKIIIFENGGYGGIRQSQSNYFEDMRFGSGPECGVGLPSFKKIAEAFDFPYCKCKNNGKITECLKWLKKEKGRAILEISAAYDDPILPKMVSKLNDDGSFTSPLLSDLSPAVDEDDEYLTSFTQWIEKNKNEDIIQ